MRATGATAKNLNEVRAYRQIQGLRILVRDVLGAINFPALQREHSALAEACLIFTQQLLAPENDLTVIALGKFGGRELSYGADLDVVFVGENTRAAQDLVVEMARATAEGAISVLDARLRPDGEKGPLTCSLAAYESYYTSRAQLWEIQALTRARAICGVDGEKFIELAQRVWRAAGQRDDLLGHIDSMRERVRRDRGSGSEGLDFKTGAGGMIEAEFLVQALQMRAGAWSPDFSGGVDDLKQLGIFAPEHANALKASYEFLRRCESILRRWENKSIATMPASEVEQRKLAQRLGSKNIAAFGEQYRNARETIHSIYACHIR